MSDDVTGCLATLEGAAKSGRAHAAIKTLRDELGVGNRKPQEKGADTPGRRAARGTPPGPDFGRNAAKAGAAARFGSKGARG